MMREHVRIKHSKTRDSMFEVNRTYENFLYFFPNSRHLPYSKCVFQNSIVVVVVCLRSLAAAVSVEEYVQMNAVLMVLIPTFNTVFFLIIFLRVQE